MNLTFFQTHLFSCVHPATAEQRCLGRWGGLLELVSSPVPPLRAGCRPPLLSACLPVRLPACLSPLVPWRSPARLLMSPDGCKKQRCSRTCRELVRGEVGVDSAKRATSKSIGLHVLLAAETPPHATLKQVVRPPPTEQANLLKCFCLFEGKKKVGVAFLLGDMLLKH